MAEELNQTNMASPSSFSILTGTLDKSQWVFQINELVKKSDLDVASQTPVSVFKLPDAVRDDDPDAYLPRRVALGPHHHFRPELQKLDLYKLGIAKKMKPDLQLNQLVEQLKPLEPVIRACFDPSLEMDGETLSWVMVINGLFLFQLLFKRYSRRPLKLPLQIFYMKLSSEYEIVCDMLMLENQIPFLVLQWILPENCIDNLSSLLYRFCGSVSPFELPLYDPESIFSRVPPNLPEIYEKSHHLLHFLCLLVLLIPDEVVMMNINECCSMDMIITVDSSVNFVKESLNILGSVANIAFLQQFKEAFSLILRLFKLLVSVTKSNLVEKTPPLIPSAADLETAGVKFKSTKNGVLKCRFDEETLTLTLPSIHLDGFSQVMLRNLVAFEAMAELNPPCLVQYIALMNGLLTNSKDVKILEEANIIKNHLGSDEEVVKLFNGVKNSTSSLKKTSILQIHLEDKPNQGNESEFFKEIKSNYDNGLKVMVEEINKWYESCRRIKMRKFMKKYVFTVLKILAILVIIVLVVLVIARLLCNFISCPGNIFKTRITADVTMFDFI